VPLLLPQAGQGRQDPWSSKIQLVARDAVEEAKAMYVTDPIADMLTRIRNANMVFHETVEMPLSKTKLAIAKILKEEGYIKNFRVINRSEKTLCDTAPVSALRTRERKGHPGLEKDQQTWPQDLRQERRTSARNARPGDGYYFDTPGDDD
jgi:hypothetical protein